MRPGNIFQNEPEQPKQALLQRLCLQRLITEAREDWVSRVDNDVYGMLSYKCSCTYAPYSNGNV